MKYFKYLVLSISLIILSSCTSSNNNTSQGIFSFVAAANTGSTGITPTHGGFLTSPASFNINIRTVQIRSDLSSWVSLEDNSFGGTPQDITGSPTLFSGVSVPADEYTAFLFGFDEGWSVSGSYNGTPYTLAYTNITGQNIYCLAATASMLSKITNNERNYTNNTWYTTLGANSYSVFGGTSYTLTLKFNSSDIVEIVTNSDGSYRGAYLYNPSFSINLN